MHALLVRHKDAMLKSAGGNRLKSRGERGLGVQHDHTGFLTNESEVSVEAFGNPRVALLRPPVSPDLPSVNLEPTTRLLDEQYLVLPLDISV